jgi:DNA-binding GntR family transcriptional regulator
MDDLERYLAKQTNSNDSDGEPPQLLREFAYERLKDAIRHADISPGYPLSESRISKILGVSRTPVREALQQLAQEGLVQVIPGRAVTVASRSIRDVLNVVHVRQLLEPEMMRLISDSISPTQLEILCEAQADMEKALLNNNQEGWSEADTVYHEILSEACPNILLGEIVVQMRNRVHHLANVDSQTNPARLEACTAEHRQIVEAIARKDGQAAAEAMRTHINALQKSLFNRLSFMQP